MSVDVNLLLYFVAVAEHLSFRRAAEQLNIAQPWLSQQIRKLEDLLGYELFIRTTRHVELTEKGQRLLKRARVMANEVDATRALALSMTAESADKLRFGIPFIALYARERVQLFDMFYQKYPNVSLEIVMGKVQQLHANLMSGNIDAMFSAGPIDENDIEALTLADQRIDLLIPSNDPLAKKAVVKLADLKDRTISAFPRPTNPPLHDALYGELEGISKGLVEYPNLTSVHSLKEHGAVTVVPGWQPLVDIGYVRKPIADYPRHVKLQLLRKRYSRPGPLENFWQLAQQLVREGDRPRQLAEAT